MATSANPTPSPDPGADTPIDPRYPIGKCAVPDSITPQHLHTYISTLAALPENLRAAVDGLSRVQIDTPYREGGWTVRQVVHHVPDSHMNAFIRLRLALTEDKPTIKPYEEARWAELADARMPIAVSQTLLDTLHERWDILWRSLKAEQFARPLIHPESGERNVDWLLFLYEWHGKHHTAHITSLRKQKAW
jgi:uncharacterized damage-inducible protein DinB